MGPARSAAAYTSRIDAIIGSRIWGSFRPDRVLPHRLRNRAQGGGHSEILPLWLTSLTASTSALRWWSRLASGALQAESEFGTSAEQKAIHTTRWPFLYAFGHIPTDLERRESLEKVFAALRPGGRFYFDVFNLDNANEWGPDALSGF